ncbi:MAG: hypothetical protein GW848_07615 [Rhodoferax sp.]|nr:hypothetical protein [Rhodoferax sp.]NCP54359.1 hypothetical protein [Rhodoferax sp.]
MHNAPVVSYPVGRSYFHAAVVVCMVFAGAANLLVWTVQPDLLLARHTVAWLVWLLCLFFAAWGWWRSPQGDLRFTGDSWQWVDPAQTQQVTLGVQLDLQQTLLVRTSDAQSRVRWLWLAHARQPQRWLDLRRAVFARQHDPQVDGSPEVSA